LADFPDKFYYQNSYRITIIITKNIAYDITEVLIFYADKLMVMGNYKNSHVFNFAILFESWGRIAYQEYLMLAKYTCFAV